MTSKNENISSLDPIQMMHKTFDGDMDAQRVIIVGGGEYNHAVSQWTVPSPEPKIIEIDRPYVVKDKEIVYIDKPHIVTEIQYKEVEKPIIVSQIEYREIEKPVIVTQIEYREIEKPIIVKEFIEKVQEKHDYVKILLCLLLATQILCTVMNMFKK